MPAYKISLKATCIKCGARATVEVFNTYNASLGKMCTKCADRKIRELNKED